MSQKASARERILVAADYLFAREGVRAVGVDRVVAEAGVAKATLYAHFSSKDDLVAAYLDRRTSAFREDLEGDLAEHGGTPAERMQYAVDALAEFAAAPGFCGCPVIKAAAELTDPAHPARVVGSLHREWFGSLFAGLAEEAGVEEPAALAERLTLLYDSIMVGAYLEPGGPAPERSREVARILIEHAIGAQARG